MKSLIENRVYMHHSGKKYCLIGVSNIKATSQNWICEAIYMDEEMTLWTRPAHQFLEKFILTEDEPWCIIKEY